MIGNSDRPEIGHRFNHDLLIHQADRDVLRRAFPELVHVLEFPELVDLFKVRERDASRAKKRSRAAGYAAIVMGAFALVMAAFEPIFADLGLTFLAPIAAALGALSVFAGSHVLHGGAKRKWLRDRLMAERYRQLHFQAFARKLPTLARSLQSDSARDAFIAERRHWLESFQFRFNGCEDAELGMALNDEEADEAWLIHPPDSIPDNAAIDPFRDLLIAYRTLRLDHQIQFASVKLDGAPGSVSELRRAESFSHLVFVAIFATFSIHGVILSLFLIKMFGGADLIAYAKFSPIAVSAIAAFVLAFRALEEGLQPGREVERYLQYRATMRAIRSRFDRATTLDEKVSAICATEAAAYTEMCTFLKIHNDAKFRM